MTRTTLGLSVATILVGLTIACGGDEPAPKAAATTAAAATTPAPAKASATTAAATTPAAAASNVTLMAVEDGDKYLFDPATLTVKAGEVTVRLSNKAGNERPHTFAVRDAAGKDIVRSGRVQPGASAEVKFTVAEAGTFTFYCALMGHEDRGHKGTLTVVKG